MYRKGKGIKFLIFQICVITSLSVPSCFCLWSYGIFKLFRIPGIDSKESIPPAYVDWRAGTTTLFLLCSPYGMGLKTALLRPLPPIYRYLSMYCGYLIDKFPLSIIGINIFTVYCFTTRFLASIDCYTVKFQHWVLDYIGRNSLLGNSKKIAKFLMRTFTCRSTFLYAPKLLCRNIRRFSEQNSICPMALKRTVL